MAQPEVLKSREDNTVKFIYRHNEQAVEVSYIDKRDGKDIFCVPTQTSCKLGCKFCYLTDLDVPVRSLDAMVIADLVKQSFNYLNAELPNRWSRTLLVSYMGSGEPLVNLDEVVVSALRIEREFADRFQKIRFAVASIIPHAGLMHQFTDLVKRSDLDIKFHWSLHTPDERLRKELMPSAIPAFEAAQLVRNYMLETGKSVEAHYTLMEGVNDRPEDAETLIEMLRNKAIPIKILRFSEKPTNDLRASKGIDQFRDMLHAGGLTTEYYEPPGRDVGASCGQFLTRYYQKPITLKRSP